MYDLNERDREILSALTQDGPATLAFDGLKRRLGVHPETLSRALDRLEEQGVITKAPEGYKATAKVEGFIPLRPLGTEEPAIPLVQSLLPQDIAPESIIALLKGRWFGSLRWFGYAENDEGVTLKWVTEDGGAEVDARFTAGTLSIEAKVSEGKAKDEAIRAAHSLVGHVARLYARPTRLGQMVAFTLFEPYHTFN
jgi:DNA-binding transcriptional regulator YhcF (GntR family)